MLSNTRHLIQRGNPKVPSTSEPASQSQSHERPTSLAANQPAANEFNTNQPGNVPLPNANFSLPQSQASTPSQTSRMVAAPTMYYDEDGKKRYTFYEPPNNGSTSQIQLPTLPTTPVQPETALASGPWTPASANKKHLARDILRSLNPRLVSGKRKRSEEPINTPTKRGRSLGISESQPTRETSAAAFSTASTSLLHDANLTSIQEPRSEHVQLNFKFVNHPLSAPPPQPIERLPTPASIPDVTASMQEATEEEEDAINEALIVSPAEPKQVQAPVFTHPIIETQQPEAGPSKAKEPLFLPSPSMSPTSAASLQYPVDDYTQQEDVVDVDAWGESMDAVEKLASHPISRQSANPKKRSKAEVYVLMPPTPAWVKRAKIKQKKAKEKRAKETQRHRHPKRRKISEQEEIIADSEQEEDPIEDWDVEAQKRAYSQATAQPRPNRRQPEGKISLPSICCGR